MAEHTSEIWTEDDGFTYWDCKICLESGYAEEADDAEREAETHLLDATDREEAKVFMPRKPRRSTYSGFSW